MWAPPRYFLCDWWPTTFVKDWVLLTLLDISLSKIGHYFLKIGHLIHFGYGLLSFWLSTTWAPLEMGHYFKTGGYFLTIFFELRFPRHSTLYNKWYIATLSYLRASWPVWSCHWLTQRPCFISAKYRQILMITPGRKKSGQILATWFSNIEIRKESGECTDLSWTLTERN